MKPAPFAYRRAMNIDEALEHLAAPGGVNRLLAGGQSLVPMLNLRLAPVDTLIDISRVEALRAAHDLGERVSYGACLPHAAFEDGRVPDCSNGFMRHVAERIAYRAVRTRGTIGGSISLADPNTDWPPVMMLLEAQLELVSRGGRRTVEAGAFFLGPYTTAAREDELLASIAIRKRPPQERWGYAKATRKAGEYASSLGLALFDPRSGRGRVTVGAVEGVPLVLDEVAQAMRSRPDEATLRALATKALDASGRGFSPAMRHMHATTIVRAVRQAIQ